MDTSKIIKAVVNARGQVTTAQTIKENYGIVLKIEGAELPEVYQVDFCNSGDTRTITMVGNTDGVLIPKQFIDTGKDIDAYLYYVGDGFGKTVYQFHIPNKYRPDRTNEEPTPEEQSIIDQTISALNDAVESTQDAQEAIEDMSVSAQTLAEGESATVTKTEQDGVVHLEFGIPKGQTGDTPNITASKTGKTTSIYVDGSEIAQIEDGTDGIDGDDGYSPTASVTKSGKTATITITDQNGTTTAQVEDGTDGTDGTDGQDGFSPKVTITPITGGHRITITDADGEHSADVMDGENGDTPNLSVGEVETLEPTDQAYATITGDPENPLLNLGIPKGMPSDSGGERLIYLDDTIGNGVFTAYQPVGIDYSENAIILESADGIPTILNNGKRASIVLKPSLGLQQGVMPLEYYANTRHYIKAIGDNKVCLYSANDENSIVVPTDTGMVGMQNTQLFMFDWVNHAIERFELPRTDHKYHVHLDYNPPFFDACGIALYNSDGIIRGFSYGDSSAKRRGTITVHRYDANYIVTRDYDGYSCVVGNRALKQLLGGQIGATRGTIDLWLTPIVGTDWWSYEAKTTHIGMPNNATKTSYFSISWTEGRGLISAPVQFVGLQLITDNECFGPNTRLAIYDCGDVT